MLHLCAGLCWAHGLRGGAGLGWVMVRVYEGVLSGMVGAGVGFDLDWHGRQAFVMHEG